jgi:hypothetical protein
VLGQPSRSSLDVELKCHDEVLYGRGRAETSGLGGAVEAWQPFLVGTPGEIVGKLAELNSFGPTKVMLWPPLHDDLDMIGLIGREVLPASDEL